jgi:hypothetical protein
MYSASGNFRTTIQSDHIVVSKAEVWTTDQKLATLNIASGSVTIDAGSAARRVCSVSLVTDRTTNNLVPDNPFDILTPFGNELRLFRGVQFYDGTVEYVPLGVFVITEVSISDNNEGVSIQVTGQDRSLIISRAKWTQPYQMVNGTLEASITNLLEDRYPDVQTDFPVTNISVNQVVLGTEQGNDPWQDIVEIANLVGYDLFFNAEGIVELKQFPTLDGAVVVAKFEEGANTTVLSIDRTISTRDTYNGVIYTIQGSEVTAPIRVEVWDEDTTSPTYRFGKFGEVPVFIETNLLSTQTQAISAAISLLNKFIGAQESISWNLIVNPTLDVQDVVYIKSEGAKVDRLVILDKLEIPLSPQDAMTAEARTVRVVATGETVIVGA